MKTLKFVNGNTIAVTDVSTITGLNVEAASYPALGAILANFTVENMKRVTFDGEEYANIIPQTVTVTQNIPDGQINAYIVCREKTEMEVMNDEITELQEAVVELAGGM